MVNLSTTVHELPFAGIGLPDLLLLTAVSMLFWLSERVIGHNVITRSEGTMFVIIYVAYMTWVVAGALNLF